MSEDNFWTKASRYRVKRRQMIRIGALAGVVLAGVAGIAGNRLLRGTRSSSRLSVGSPKRGGTLRLSLDSTSPHWDVHTVEEIPAAAPAHYAYSSLLKLDEVRGPDLTTEFILQSDLAEAFEQPQPDILVFRLRRGVKFHDRPPVNGRELTAEDVKYSIDRIRSPEPQFLRRSMFEEIERIEVLDKHSIKLSIIRPSAPLLYNLASPWTSIAAREVADRDGDLRKTLIGSGPFLLDSFNRNASVRFKRNPDYFLKDRPFLEGIDVVAIPNAAVALAALQSKELDLGPVTYVESEKLRETDPSIEVIEFPSMTKFTCLMRIDRPPLNDRRVRRALMHATNYQEFIDVMAQSRGRRDGPLQWWLRPYALPAEELPATDLEVARQLLAEAGYANGFKLQATVTAGLDGVRSAEIAQSQWRSVGIEIEVKTLEWGAWVDTVWSKKDFAVTFLQDQNHEDPNDWLFPNFHGKGGHNLTGYSSPEVDALLERQRESLNVGERSAMLKDVQKLLLDDAAYIPLFTPISYFARHPYLRDWNPHSSWAGQHSFGALRGWLNK